MLERVINGLIKRLDEFDAKNLSLADTSHTDLTLIEEKLTELTAKVSKIEEKIKLPYSSVVASSLPLNKSATSKSSDNINKTMKTTTNPQSPANTNSQRNRKADFNPNRCLVISSSDTDSTNIRALTHDQIRHTLSANHGPIIIELINRYKFGSDKPKFIIQLSSTQAVNDVISKWKTDSFGGSVVRNTIRPKDVSLQGMAKGLPLDISDDEIKTALAEHYPGSTPTRLVKNGKKLRTVNIYFASSEMRSEAVDKGLPLQPYNMLFRVEPLHPPVNHHVG